MDNKRQSSLKPVRGWTCQCTGDNQVFLDKIPKMFYTCSKSVKIPNGHVLPDPFGPIDIISVESIKFLTEPTNPVTITIYNNNNPCYSFVQNGSGKLNLPYLL